MTMEMLWRYQMTGELTNQNAGYSLWGFAKYAGRDYFVKQFLSPKFPIDDTVSSPERLKRITDRCQKFIEKKKKIYDAVNAASDGNDIRICEFFRVESRYYISMEKITAIPWSIEDIFKLKDEQRRRLCAIVSHSIAALHSGRLVHADVKHENILYTHTPRGTITAKITDFDSAFLETDPPKDGEEIVGDWVYFSPEIWERTNGGSPTLSCKMDVFALGVLFHQYFSGKLPDYDHDGCSSVGQAVLLGKEIQISDAIPEDVAELISQMLSLDPEQRPTAQEVFERIQPKSTKDAIDAQKRSAASGAVHAASPVPTSVPAPAPAERTASPDAHDDEIQADYHTSDYFSQAADLF